MGRDGQMDRRTDAMTGNNTCQRQWLLRLETSKKISDAFFSSACLVGYAWNLSLSRCGLTVTTHYNILSNL